MSRRNTGLLRPYPIDVRVSALEDEMISRESWQCGLSKAAYLRKGRIPESVDMRRLAHLRRIQAGKDKFILRAKKSKTQHKGA